MYHRMDERLHTQMKDARPPVSGTVDAVARAICKSRSCEGVNCCQWPSQGARKSNCVVDRGGYDEAAKEAIGKLQELSLLPIALAG
jgi:hypothetical protein